MSGADGTSGQRLNSALMPFVDTLRATPFSSTSDTVTKKSVSTALDAAKKRAARLPATATFSVRTGVSYTR